MADEEIGFLYIDHPVTSEDIRMLLTALADEEACSQSTRELFGSLGLLPPSIRLAENFSRLMSIMAIRPVTKVLQDGLLAIEREALLELERLDFSIAVRKVAHNLLNVKERQQVNKQLCGYFGRMRHALDGHLNLGEDFNDEGNTHPSSDDRLRRGTQIHPSGTTDYIF